MVEFFGLLDVSCPGPDASTSYFIETRTQELQMIDGKLWYKYCACGLEIKHCNNDLLN